MPRQKRQKSETGIYHVILRGINKQIIFEDVEDYKKLLGTIESYKKKCGFKIYAYCLMGNHIHLLIEVGSESLGCIFRKIGSKYVLWYNKKYQRSGHLFQGRFKSEVVENEQYFFTLLRYIHQNPVKGQIVKHVKDYPWTSYEAYMKGSGLCDTQRVIEYLSLDLDKGRVMIQEMLNALTDEKCLEYDDAYTMSDANASTLIKELTDLERTKTIGELDQKERNLLLFHLKGKGITYKQMARLTGVTFSVIKQVLSSEKIETEK